MLINIQLNVMKYSEICKLAGKNYYTSNPISQGSKECSMCHEVKAIKGFCKNRKYPDNYHPWCINCTNLINEKREIQQRLAKPKWFSNEHKKQINQLKNEAEKQTVLTSTLHSVCHIEPIQHWLICGLDIPKNMYIDTQKNNADFSNHFVPYRIDENGTIENIELSVGFIIDAFNFNEKFNTARNQRYREPSG